jgi:predicted transcriptional regulator
MAGRTQADTLERRRIIARMHSAGMGLSEIGGALGISKAAVCAHVAKIKRGQFESAPRRAVSHDLVIGLVAEGLTRTQIAKKVGISQAYVSIILSENGYSANSTREVPAWVPSDLRPDYIDFASDFGEHYAAREVRRLKAEAA